MAVMYGKTKRFKLNEIFQTAKGNIKFLRYIETEENQPKVEFLNLTTGKIEIDYYGIVYYKVIKQHKKLGIPVPESVKYEYEIDFIRPLKFGVELEIIVPYGINLTNKLKDAGINMKVPDRIHDVIEDAWKLVQDGSIRAPYGYSGYELVSPPSTNFDDLKTICKILKDNGVKTNISCGLHVHHDINDLKRKQIVRIYDFYNKYESLIDKMHTKARDDNKFCRPLYNIIDRVRNAETLNQMLVDVAGKGYTHHYMQCRYYKINLRSYLFYGTIEFRQADATIEYDKIVNWITFTHKIVERGLQIGNDIQQMESEELREYRENPTSQYENMMKELGLYHLTDVWKNLLKRVEKRVRRAA